MRTIVDWIEERLDNELTLDEVTAKAGCSRYHFERIFREHSGLSVVAYIRRRAHLHAARCLAGGATVTEAALRYGYQSASAFTRAFGRTFGMTPSSYREMIQKDRSKSTDDAVVLRNAINESTLRQGYDLADFLLKLSSRGHIPYTFEYFEKQQKDRSPFLLCAKQHGRVIGVAFGAPRNNNVTVAFVAVEADKRRRGIGGALLKELIDRARDRGYEGMAMGSDEGSEEFFAKCGFSPTLFLQSHDHSLDELRAVNDRYPELWGRESGLNGWRQLMLETPRVDTELRQKYDELFEDCIPQTVFRMRFAP